MAKSKLAKLTISDCADLLRVALAAIEDEGYSVRMAPSPAADDMPDGMVCFVEGLTVLDGTIVPQDDES